MACKPHRNWRLLQLPTVDYETALHLQRNLQAARQTRFLTQDTVVVLEHFPVYTLGRRGILADVQSLSAATGIPVVQVERGGEITYHGPGQIVVYPIVHLPAAGLSVVDFVTGLEEAMIRTAAQWGIPAERNPLNRGVWVGLRKLGSVGIAVRRSIAFHGLALNVDLDLTPFTRINPCGLTGIEATSLEAEAGFRISAPSARRVLQNCLAAVFDVTWMSMDPWHGQAVARAARPETREH